MARHLQRAGWRLLARRAPLHGVEVDLLLERGDRVLLVEVKSGRRSGPRWRPADRFGPSELRRLQRAARGLRRSAGEGLVIELRLYEVLARPGIAPRLEHVPIRCTSTEAC